MTIRTNEWLKANFQSRDPQDFHDDLIDSLSNGLWTQSFTQYYVDSSDASASDANPGTDPDDPLATIDGAFGKTLVPGDIVWVLPGHVESLAAAQIDMDLPGVFVIGIGSGDSLPQVHFDNAAASVDIGANNITISGIRFLPSVTDVLIGVDIEAGVTGTIIQNCEFMLGEDGAGVDEFVLSIDVKAGCHSTVIVGNQFYTHAAAAGATDAIKLTGASNQCRITDNIIDGTYSTAGITNDTAAALNLHVADNTIKVADGEPGIELFATATGRIIHNVIASTGLNVDVMIVAADCEWSENYGVDTDGETGQLIGVPSDAPTNFIGLNDANNAADTGTVARNEDGSILERLEDIIADLVGAAGVATFPAAAKATDAVSMAEVLRHVDDAQEQSIIKTDGAVLAVADPLFDITGGPIMVTGFVGIVTTIVGGAANCQIQVVTTTPAATTNLSTDVAIDNDAAGTSYTFTNVALPVFTPTTNGGVANVAPVQWLCPIGTIQADTDAAQTGVIAWYMIYKPLSPLSVVVASA